MKIFFTKIAQNSDTECYYIHPSTISSLDNSIYISYNSFKVECKKLVNGLHSSNKNEYAYFYQPCPDYLMHKLRVNSLIVKWNVLYPQRQIKRYYKKAPDNTLFIITADHGLCNISNYIFLKEDKEIFKMMKRRISIEGRAASFFIKKEYKELFREVFIRKYGDKFILKSHDEVIKEELFGPGKVNKQLDISVGDYLAIAISDSYLLYSSKAKKVFKTAHAGMTEDETVVPLITLYKNKKVPK